MKEIWTNSMNGLKGVAKRGAQDIIKEVQGVHLTPPTVSSMNGSRVNTINDNRTFSMDVNSSMDVQELERVMVNTSNRKRSLSGNL